MAHKLKSRRKNPYHEITVCPFILKIIMTQIPKNPSPRRRPLLPIWGERGKPELPKNPPPRASEFKKKFGFSRVVVVVPFKNSFEKIYIYLYSYICRWCEILPLPYYSCKIIMKIIMEIIMWPIMESVKRFPPSSAIIKKKFGFVTVVVTVPFWNLIKKNIYIHILFYL